MVNWFCTVSSSSDVRGAPLVIFHPDRMNFRYIWIQRWIIWSRKCVFWISDLRFVWISDLFGQYILHIWHHHLTQYNYISFNSILTWENIETLHFLINDPVFTQYTELSGLNRSEPSTIERNWLSTSQCKSAFDQLKSDFAD